MDMVGFTVGDASVRVMNKDEYVDQVLTDFVRLIITEYTSFTTRDRQCTYACRFVPPIPHSASSLSGACLTWSSHSALVAQ